MAEDLIKDGIDQARAATEDFARADPMETANTIKSGRSSGAADPHGVPDPGPRSDLDRALKPPDDGAQVGPVVRPTIRIVAGQLPRVVDELETALIDANLGFYQRGSLMVRPALVWVAIADGRKVLAQRLVQVKTYHLAEAITRASKIERFDRRSKGWIPTDCPLRVAETLLSREGLWRFPVLLGVINRPILRPDGSILEQPGYDQATGLLFDPQNTTFPRIPAHPSRDDALAALGVLDSLIEAFPFVGGADRAVALSAIVTAVIRPSIPTAPLHGFTAPLAGTGKSMLVDIASLVAAGRPAAVIAQGKTEEEMEKRLGAAVIAGDYLISIDNCESALGGEFLCQALTQKFLKVRILGKSINAEVPNIAAVYATGNNLTFAGDLSRRVVRCSLDPGVERPELRKFDSDPITTLEADRGAHVVAALTVLRAFHVAGRPEQVNPLGSFVEWSDWVRSALIWLGVADPCDTTEEVRSTDPKLAALTSVLEQWSVVLGDRRCSAKEAIDAANEQTDVSHGNEFVHPDFREALLGVAGERGTINSRRLGKWLSANQNRIVGRKKIVMDGGRGGTAIWRLQQVDADK